MQEEKEKEKKEREKEKERKYQEWLDEREKREE